MTRPWLIHLRPFALRYEGRADLAQLASGLSTEEFVNKCWDARIEAAAPIQRPRSRSWPKSCKTKGGYVLPERKNNVTSIRRKKP